MSIGEWSATVGAWNGMHGTAQARPPSRQEFEAAVTGARW